MQAQYQNQAPATIEGLIRKVFEGEDFYSFAPVYGDDSGDSVYGYGTFEKRVSGNLQATVDFEAGVGFSDTLDELSGRFTVEIEGPRWGEYVHYEWLVGTRPGDKGMQDLIRLFPKAEECVKIAAAQVFSTIVEYSDDYADATVEHAKMMLGALDPNGTLDY